MSKELEPKIEIRKVTDANGKTKIIKRIIRRKLKDPNTKTLPEETPAVMETPTPTPSLLPMETPAPGVTPGGQRKWREVNNETVQALFNELLTVLNEELHKHKGKPDKREQVKLFRELLKKGKLLEHDVTKLLKKKYKQKYTKSEGVKYSGFQKQCKVTDELADFLELKRGATVSRVDCSKKIHAYVMAHNLQNPQNRREIFPDKVLTKLLKYNKKSKEDGGHGPLYYHVVQQLVQKHFIKEN